MVFLRTFLTTIVFLLSLSWNQSMLVAADGKTAKKGNSNALLSTMEMLSPDRAHRIVHGESSKLKGRQVAAADVGVEGMPKAASTASAASPSHQEERFAQGQVVAGYHLLPRLVEGTIVTSPRYFLKYSNSIFISSCLTAVDICDARYLLKYLDFLFQQIRACRNRPQRYPRVSKRPTKCTLLLLRSSVSRAWCRLSTSPWSTSTSNPLLLLLLLPPRPLLRPLLARALVLALSRSANCSIGILLRRSPPLNPPARRPKQKHQFCASSTAPRS